MKRWIALALGLLLLLGLCACGKQAAQPAAEPVPDAAQVEAASAQSVQETTETAAEESAPTEAPQPEVEPFTTASRIVDVIADPAFAGYGRLLFPIFQGPGSENFQLRDNMTLKEMYMLLPSYHNINAEYTADMLTQMKTWSESGQQIFFDLYTAEEKAADPAKENTGLFFFPGEPGGKFAVCTAGQGFKYVAAIHDSFPQAMELSRHGYNAFAIIYRPGAVSGCEDLTRAVDLIFDHAQELGIDTGDYSLWGGAAGGRIAAWVSQYGTAAFGGAEHPKPATVVTQYCGLYSGSINDVPNYVIVGTRDTFTRINIPMRVTQLEAVHVDVMYESIEDAYHGFGLGIGGPAEGWIERAISFWEQHMTG